MPKTLIKIEYDNLTARITRPERLSAQAAVRVWERLQCEQERFYRKGEKNVSYVVHLQLYDRETGEFPTGLLSLVRSVLRDEGYLVVCKDERGDPPKKQFHYESSCNLWEFQGPAVDKMVDAVRGVVFVGTGGGKTEIFASAISRLGVRSLVLVFAQEMANQTITRLAGLYGIEESDIGFIGSRGGKPVFDPKDITVGMVQTLAAAVPRKTKLHKKKRISKETVERHLRIQEYLETVLLLVVDEGHHGAADQWYSISQACTNAYYRFYLTGTPYREDGYGLLFHASSGRRIVQVPARRLIETGHLDPPTIHLIGVPMRSSEVFRDFKSAYEHHVVRNPNVTRFVAEMICQMMRYGRKILVLVRYISQGDLLSRALDELKCPWFLRYAFVHARAEDREDLVRRFADNSLTSDDRLNVLIGTAKLFREFLDVPAINTVITLEGGRSRAVVEQGLGRALRRGSGALYVDFDVKCGGSDARPRMLERHSAERMKIALDYVKDQGAVYHWPILESKNVEKLVEKMILTEVSPGSDEISKFRIRK